jgi:hypothetical protein
VGMDAAHQRLRMATELPPGQRQLVAFPDLPGQFPGQSRDLLGREDGPVSGIG